MQFTSAATRAFTLAALAASTALASCGGDDPDDGSPTSDVVLVERDMQVGGNGAFANVTFDLNVVHTVRITLTTVGTSLPSPTTPRQPYGSITRPSGDSFYNPPLETAANGSNHSEIALDEIGRYTLTVFDGSGLGGTFHVKVERID